MCSIEKDQAEISPKQSQECSAKVNFSVVFFSSFVERAFQVLELHKHLEAARAQIRALPGIDLNKEDQLQKLENLRTQLVLKQDLIKKYKNVQFWVAGPRVT